MTRSQHGYWSAAGGFFGRRSSGDSRCDSMRGSRTEAPVGKSSTYITVRSGSSVGAEDSPTGPKRVVPPTTSGTRDSKATAARPTTNAGSSIHRRLLSRFESSSSGIFGDTSTTTTPEQSINHGRAPRAGDHSSSRNGSPSIIPTWQRGRIRVPRRRNTTTDLTTGSSTATQTRAETTASAATVANSRTRRRRKPIVVRAFPRERERIAKGTNASGSPFTSNEGNSSTGTHGGSGVLSGTQLA
ncbi:hypothetical protein FGRMN_1845 [Fusarium graminum]|nr:hypothetical protein FGRMN_1845 [Fusarium graminum]